MTRSDKFQLAGGDAEHAEEKQAVAPALDVGGAVGAFPIADGDVADFEVLFVGAEEQVEVAERIKLAEVGAVGGDLEVVFAGEDLGAAERVFDALAEEPGESQAEEFIGDHVEELHGLFLHRVDEAGAVGELGFAAGDGLVKLGELLGRHGEVGVEDHEDVAGGGGIGLADGVAFALAGLTEGEDAPVGIRGAHALDLVPRVVLGMTFDEDEFGPCAHVRSAQDGGLDVAGFVAGGDDDGDGERFRGGGGAETGDGEEGEAGERQERCDPAVEHGCEHRCCERPENARLAFDDLPLGEFEEVFHVVRGKPVGGGDGRAQAQPLAYGEDGAPEIVVEVDEQAGGGRGDGGEALEELLDVGGEVEGFGDDDDVEGFAEIEVFAGLGEKGGIGNAGAGAGELGFGEVDAGFAARVEEGEEFAVAAADLEDGGAGGDEPVIVMGEQPAVAAAGGGRLGRACVKVNANGFEMFFGKASQRRRHGGFVGVEPPPDGQLVNARDVPLLTVVAGSRMKGVFIVPKTSSPAARSPLPSVLAGVNRWWPVFVAAVTGYYLSFALFSELFRLVGVGHMFGWFFDSYAILASNDAAAAGKDAFAYNPLDPLGRPHVYSHWWLNLSALGLTRGHNFILGGFFVVSFFAAVFWWLRPRTAGEAGWYWLVIAAGPVVLGVERANNDLLMLALLMPVVPMMRSDRGWVRWCALIPVAVATGLKFYPAVAALVLLAGENRREVTGRGLTAAAVLVLVGLDVRGDLAKMGGFVPNPSGLMTFGAGQVFAYFGMGKAAAAMCGVLLGVATMIALRPWRWFSGWVVAEKDRGAWLAFVLGAVVLTGCFFAGSSYGYRLIYGVLLAPFLWRLTRDAEAPAKVRRLGRVTAGLLMFLLWGDMLAAAVLSPLITAESAARIQWIADQFAIWGEPLVWAFFTCLSCFLAVYVREVWRVVFSPRGDGARGVK
jgi:hypothetical protein